LRERINCPEERIKPMKNQITTERANLFDVNMMIAMRINVEGRATEEQLRRAFERAVSSHEILNTFVEIDEDGNAWYEPVDEETDADYGNTGNQSITFCKGNWRDILREQEQIRFRVEEGEFLRAICYRLTDHSFHILFCMHHLGGDGKSLVYFIQTFMEALCGKELEYREMQLLTPDTMTKASGLPFLYKMMVRKYNRKWKKERCVFSFEDLDLAHQNYWMNHETAVQEVTLTEKRIQKMLSDCKAWHIGFTAYITTMFLKQLGGKRDIGYAVDGRQDENRAMGNQATGISVQAYYDEKRSFEENAVIIHKKMNKKLGQPIYKYFILHFMAAFDPCLVDAVNLEHAGIFTGKTPQALAKQLGYGDIKKDLSITNLSRLDIPHIYGQYRICDFCFIPPVISNGKNIIGIATVDNKTSFTLHTCVDGKSSLKLTQLLGL